MGRPFPISVIKGGPLVGNPDLHLQLLSGDRWLVRMGAAFSSQCNGFDHQTLSLSLFTPHRHKMPLLRQWP